MCIAAEAELLPHIDTAAECFGKAAIRFIVQRAEAGARWHTSFGAAFTTPTSVSDPTKLFKAKSD